MYYTGNMYKVNDDDEHMKNSSCFVLNMCMELEKHKSKFEVARGHISWSFIEQNKTLVI